MRELALSITTNGFGGDSILGFYAVSFDENTGILGESLDLSFNPGFVLTSKVTSSTGITNAMLDGCPRFSVDSAKKILDFIKGARLWMHSDSADVRILGIALRRAAQQSFSDVAHVSYVSTLAKSLGHAKTDLAVLADYYKVGSALIRSPRCVAELVAQVSFRLLQSQARQVVQDREKVAFSNKQVPVALGNRFSGMVHGAPPAPAKPAEPVATHMLNSKLFEVVDLGLKPPLTPRPLRIPTQLDFQRFNGGHSPTNWRATPGNWVCPCCNRSKFRLLRWTDSRQIGRPSGGKKWMALIERDPITNEFVCQTCRTAAQRVKLSLKIPVEFHFYPSEMRRFIKCWDYGGAKVVDQGKALEIYRARKNSVPGIPSERMPPAPSRPRSVEASIQRPLDAPFEILARPFSSSFSKSRFQNTGAKDFDTRSALVSKLAELLPSASDDQLSRVAAILLESNGQSVQGTKRQDPIALKVEISPEQAAVSNKPAKHGKPWDAVDDAALREKWFTEPLRTAVAFGLELQRSEAAVIGKLVSLGFYKDADSALEDNKKRVPD